MLKSRWVLNRIVKAGNEVSGTYEITATTESLFVSTPQVKEIFDISDEFEHDFIKAISTFDKTQIGPYITERYFMLIPELKEAMLQLKDDCIETRRCVIQFPKDHCFQTMQFMVRENTVHVVCYMRSCDAIKNFPHDVWICSKMADIFAKYLSDMTGIQVYAEHKITMMFGSLHVFKEDIKNVL